MECVIQMMGRLPTPAASSPALSSWLCLAKDLLKQGMKISMSCFLSKEIIFCKFLLLSYNTHQCNHSWG